MTLDEEAEDLNEFKMDVVSWRPAYTGWEDARNDLAKAVTFRDGTPLPANVMYDCLRILVEKRVAIPWQKDDIRPLNNLGVSHARRPFEPPRRVSTWLCK